MGWQASADSSSGESSSRDSLSGENVAGIQIQRAVAVLLHLALASPPAASGGLGAGGGIGADQGGIRAHVGTAIPGGVSGGGEAVGGRGCAWLRHVPASAWTPQPLALVAGPLKMSSSKLQLKQLLI
jgi:hypothetical protein